jgi:hypothetical protein
MTINTGLIADLLRPGLKAVQTDLGKYPAKWKEIYTQLTSDKNIEYTVEMKLTGLAQFKPEGTQMANDNMNEFLKTPFYNRTVGLSFTITREAVEDNLYKEFFPLSVKSLTDSLQQFKLIQSAAPFNNGFNPAFPLADGQPYFSQVHPISNGLVPNTPAIPAQLNETSLQDAIVAIQLFKSAAGMIMTAEPLALLVPPQLQFTADVLLNSKYKTGTNFNDESAIYNMRSIPKGAITHHFLTSPTAWYLLTDRSDGLKYFQRRALDINSFADTTGTENVSVAATERYSFGVDNFRSAYGSQG